MIIYMHEMQVLPYNTLLYYDIIVLVFNMISISIVGML